MLADIINITLPVVVKEIEIVLDGYPHHPYQQAFATPHLRQKLITYVLSQVPAHYRVYESSSVYGGFEGLSLEEHLQVEVLIRQGIQHILCDNAQWASRHIPEAVSVGEAPSHWFG